MTSNRISMPIETGGGSDLSISTDIEVTRSPGPVTSIPVESWNHHGTDRSMTVETSGVVPGHNRLRGPWDSYDAYLFDIDGTLLHCRDAVHYFAFCDVLTHIAGRVVNLDGVPVQGKIDPGIVRDAFDRAGVPESLWQPQLPAILERMGAYVEAHTDEFDIDVLPGIRETLLHLQRRGKLLGVGTGNLERIGWAKLNHCGLRSFFTLGGFSDRFAARGPMIASAVAAARVELGNPGATVLVLGDTPGDIAAARFAGVDVLAVATGIYTADKLQEADRVAASMRDLLPEASTNAKHGHG